MLSHRDEGESNGDLLSIQILGKNEQKTVNCNFLEKKKLTNETFFSNFVERMMFFSLALVFMVSVHFRAT